jgi:hypothetical protein
MGNGVISFSFTVRTAEKTTVCTLLINRMYLLGAGTSVVSMLSLAQGLDHSWRLAVCDAQHKVSIAVNLQTG